MHNVLHVILVCKQTPVPNTLLNALVQTVILGTYFFSSLALDSYLQTNPNARPSFLARISPLLDVVLLDVVSHPLSYALAKPTVLPSTCTPFNRRRLSEVMSNLITDPSFRDVVTYAVMFTSGPPFPCQLVVSCGPIHAALTSHDLLILSCLSTHDSQQNRLSQTRTSAQTQHKVYPQAWNFERGFHLVSRHVELRLHPDHYDRFKSAVGGHSWRPEWTHRPPHSVTVSLLTSNVDSAYCFLDQLECRLDRASDVTSLLICMERPLNMHPLSVHGVRDIIVLNARDRVAGTLGAFAYPAAICALMTMQRADSGEMDGKTCDSNLFVRTFAKIGLRVVYWRRRIVVLFDLRDSTSDAAAVHVTRNILEPQINRYMRHIIPPDERVVIHARTPLAGFLAPFVS